jgi:broad specificity phosphatase PhoE
MVPYALAMGLSFYELLKDLRELDRTFLEVMRKRQKEEQEQQERERANREKREARHNHGRQRNR